MYAIALFAFLLAILGYGTLVQRTFHGEARDLAYSAALGVAALIVIGGVLNALGLAYGPAIDVVLFSGVAIALALFARLMASAEGRARSVDACRRVLRWPAAWLAALCFAFTTFFLAPTLGYNPHDDMVQYLTRPYVMMSFGSVGANWFDSTGADSLGAQSWLLSFFLRYLPLAYANVLDAAIMLSLTCALLAAFGARLGTPSWLVIAAILMILMLNPSQVNVSAIFSLALMVAGLAMALLRTADTYVAGAGKTSWRWLIGLVPAGVFLAALAALKTTAALWGVLFAIAFVYVATISLRSWRETMAAVTVVGASGAATVVLWIVPFYPLYLASLVAGQEWPEQPTTPEPYCRYIYDCWNYAWQSSRVAWFSVEPVQNGQIGLSVTLCCVIIMIALLQPRFSRERSKTWKLQHLMAFSAIGFASVAFFAAAPALFPWAYLRYPAPLVFIVTSLALLFAGAATVTASDQGVLRSTLSWRWGGALLVPMVVIAVLVVHDFNERLGLAIGQRTSLQLARQSDFQTGVRRLFSSDRRDKIRALQARIPPGSTILAAIVTPTHLDFQRNPIFPHFHAAFSTPWWGDISTATPADIRHMLVSRGIEYVIWQHGGDWIVPEAALISDARTRAWVVGTAARNSLPLLRTVTAQRIGPTVYRGADYIISRVLESFDDEPSEYSIVLGTPIDFAAGADYTPYLSAGWSFREAGGVWSDGPVAVLRFDLERRPERPLRLEAELSTFPRSVPLGVTVEANGQRVAAWDVAGTSSTSTHSTYCATIPAEAVPEHAVSVTLNIDDPKSPAERGINADTRRLGIMLKRARLSVGGESEPTCSLDD